MSSSGAEASLLHAASFRNVRAPKLGQNRRSKFRMRRVTNRPLPTKLGMVTCDFGEPRRNVVQEVLLAIPLKRHTWDADRAIDPWIMTITRNKLIDAPRCRGELCRILGDYVNQAADFFSDATSIPSRNVTPLTTFGN